jgi:hypothetical protein
MMRKNLCSIITTFSVVVFGNIQLNAQDLINEIAFSSEYKEYRKAGDVIFQNVRQKNYSPIEIQTKIGSEIGLDNIDICVDVSEILIPISGIIKYFHHKCRHSNAMIALEKKYQFYDLDKATKERIREEYREYNPR